MILQGQGGREIRKKVTIKEVKKKSPKSSKSKSSNSRSRSKDKVPLNNQGVKQAMEKQDQLIKILQKINFNLLNKKKAKKSKE